MSNPDAVDAIGGDTTSFSSNDIKNASSSNKFLTEVQSVVGKTTLTTKYKEKGCPFKIDVDIASNTVIVKSAAGTEISPSATTPWAD